MIDGFARVKRGKNKKGIEEIRWGGTSEDMIWKSPITNFSSGSNVVVNEWQGAVFYLNGEASEELLPGQHILETCNISWGSRIMSAILRERVSFSAELFYVNKTEMTRLRFGVGDISYTERGYTFPIGTRGVYNIVIENPRKLIEKFNVIQLEELPVPGREVFTKQNFQVYFVELVGSLVRDVLANTLKERQISILDRDTKLRQIAKAVNPYIEELFEEYGIRLTQFTIEQVKVPMKGNPGFDAYNRLLSLVQKETNQDDWLKIIEKERTAKALIDAKVRDISSQGEAIANKNLGTSHIQERQLDIMEKAIQHDNVTSNITNSTGDIVQAAMGLGTAGVVANMAYQQLNGMQNIFQANTVVCPHCGKTVAAGNFCSNCSKRLKMEMSVCENCGYQLKEDEKFCPNCGNARR